MQADGSQDDMQYERDRQRLLKTLEVYGESWCRAPYLDANPAEDRQRLQRILDFIHATPQAFSRQNLAGHVTGSALVVNPHSGQVLLTLHKKLNKWLQLGGHVDGASAVHREAHREACEESGSDHIQWFDADAFSKAFRLFQKPSRVWRDVLSELPAVPFDVDVHQIPDTPKEPAHFHYDIRYVLWCDQPESILLSDESHDLKWFAMEEARRVTSQQPSMWRQFRKLEWFLDSL